MGKTSKTNKSNDKKLNKETQSPMLNIFKQIMQREYDDPEKTNLLKGNRDNKKRKQYSVCGSDQDLKSCDSSGSEKLKVLHYNRETKNSNHYNDYNTLIANQSKPLKDMNYLKLHMKKNCKPKTSVCSDNASQTSIPAMLSQCHKRDAKMKSDDDTASGVTCELKKLATSQYTCMICLCVALLLIGITGCLMFFHSSPTETRLRTLEDGDCLRKKIEVLGSGEFGDFAGFRDGFDDGYRRDWDDSGQRRYGVPVSVREYGDRSYRYLNNKEDSSNKLFDMSKIFNRKLEDKRNSEELKNFYKKLIQTDAQIKHLKKSINSLTKKTENDRKKRSIRKHMKKRNIIQLKNIKLMKLNNIRQKFNTNPELKEHKRNNTNPKLVIERNVTIKYRDGGRKEKCSFTPKDNKPHETKLKHPFYKNTGRFEDFLDQFLGRHIKDSDIVSIESNKDKEKGHEVMYTKVVDIKKLKLNNDFDVVVKVTTTIKPRKTTPPIIKVPKRKLMQAHEDYLGYEDLNEISADDIMDAHGEEETQKTHKLTEWEKIKIWFKNHPQGVHNPNWKGPIPLYSDEIIAMAGQCNSTINKKVIPSKTKGTGHDILIALEGANTDFLDGKNELELQAYSDYGVLDRKKINNDEVLKIIPTKLTNKQFQNRIFERYKKGTTTASGLEAASVKVHDDKIVTNILKSHNYEARNGVDEINLLMGPKILIKNLEHNKEYPQTTTSKFDMYIRGYKHPTRNHERLQRKTGNITKKYKRSLKSIDYNDYFIFHDAEPIFVDDKHKEIVFSDKQPNGNVIKDGIIITNVKLVTDNNNQVKDVNDHEKSINNEFRETDILMKDHENHNHFMGNKERKDINKVNKVTSTTNIDKKKTKEKVTSTTNINKEETETTIYDKRFHNNIFEEDNITSQFKVVDKILNVTGATVFNKNSDNNKVKTTVPDNGFDKEAKNIMGIDSKKKTTVGNKALKNNTKSIKIINKVTPANDSSNNSMNLSEVFAMISTWFNTLAAASKEYHHGNGSNINNNINESQKIEKIPDNMKDLSYPSYDSDMIENIAHRSRVLLSINTNASTEPKIGSAENEKYGLDSGETETVSTTVTNTNATKLTERDVTNTERDRNITNKTIIKRSLGDSGLIFWNDIYDDEYDVENDPTEKEKRKINSFNFVKKSEDWLQDKVKRINYFRRKKNERRDTRSVKYFRTDMFPRETSKHTNRNIKLTKYDDTDRKFVNFAELTDKMKKACKEAAQEVQQTSKLKVRHNSKEETVTTNLMQQLVHLMLDLVNYQVHQMTCLKLSPDLQAFLEWLTSPIALVYRPDNFYYEDKASFNDDGKNNQKYYEATNNAQEVPFDNIEHFREGYSDALKSVKELIQDYNQLPEDDKNKIRGTGIINYLNVQLKFLNKQINSVDVFDISPTFPNLDRYKRNIIPDSRKKFRKGRKRRVRKHFRHIKKHTATTSSHVTDKKKNSLKPHSA